ncbi:hypothetical protein [Paenibacillus pini]|uniref:Uncharacterized protein n=1 Tax=Paenibacillus pini JCM 16418 TaxID=1236976 RepID=W7YG72_9BACL|nr:hypothetical protein [Paenibacillus pini]GAF09925.1 hypothetical protein JCM16418_4089 [Paenibacillus pini JCM 16418]
MSMPNVPDIKPEIELKRQDVVNLLLSSIAMEEMGLSHIINAEGEKLQRIVQSEDSNVKDILDINESVERMLRNIIKNQMLLQFKLEDIIKLEKMSSNTEFHNEYHAEYHEE